MNNILTARMGSIRMWFDIKTTAPKRLVRCVPGGSVYYFRIINDSDQAREQIFLGLNGVAISDSGADEGFGIAYTGRVIL